MKLARLVLLAATVMLGACDLPAVPTGTQAAAPNSGDPALDAFLSDQAEPDPGDALDGVKGLGTIKLPVTLALKRTPAGDVPAGSSVTFSLPPATGKLLGVTWDATAGTKLVKKGDDVAVWTPEAKRTSALKLTARSVKGGKGVLYVVAFTDGTTIKFRDVLVTSVLPAGWLQANDPFKATPRPSAPASVSPSAAPSPLDLGEAPPCAAPATGLTLQNYLDLYWSHPDDHAANYCAFRQGIQDFPDDYNNLVIFAVAAHNFKRYAEAVPAIEHALEVAPDNGWVKDNYWVVIAMAGVNMAWDQKRWADGAYFVERGLRIKPDDAWGWAYVGLFQRNAGNDEAALAAWQKAYALDPAHVPTNYKANFMASLTDGIARLRQAGKLDLATAYAELGVKAYPEEASYRNELIGLYLATNKTAQAQALVDAMPEGAAKQVARGSLQFATGDQQGALATFRAADRAFPDDWALDHQVGLFYRAKIDALPYNQQMASPFQDLALEFEHAAVPKYFRLHPYTQTETFHPPLFGRFSVWQGAGGKSFHNGVTGHYSWDLGMSTGTTRGTEIHAIAPGTVVQAIYTNADRPDGMEPQPGVEANIVVLEHANGLVSKYVHVQQNSGTLKAGDHVTAGQVVAKIGNTGYSTGAHLHFEVDRKDGDLIVPVPITLTGLQKVVGGRLSAADRLAEDSDPQRDFDGR